MRKFKATACDGQVPGMILSLPDECHFQLLAGNAFIGGSFFAKLKVISLTRTQSDDNAIVSIDTIAGRESALLFQLE